MAASVRYILIEYNGNTGTNAIVLPDLILTDVNMARVLSGDDSFSATIPTDPRIYDRSGHLILKQWASAIVVEIDGRIDSVYLISSYSENENTISLTGVGLTGYLSGQPYRAVHLSHMDNCAALFRHLWRHHQAYPGSNLGITVDEYMSRVKIGYIRKEGDRTKVEELQAKQEAAQKAEETAQAASDKKPNDKALKAAYEKLKTAREAIDAQLKTAQEAADKVSKENDAYNEKMEKAGYQEYRLAWYDNVDLGSKAQELAETGRFDYYIKHWWEGDSIRSHIVLMDDDRRAENSGRFVVGENIIQDPQLDFASERYATDVWVTGTGEGASMIFGVSPHDTTRTSLTRWVTIQDKTCIDKFRAIWRAQYEADTRRSSVALGEIVCADHPNAPRNSVALGDFIYIVGDGHGYNATIDTWARVTGISYDPTSSYTRYTVVTY